MRFPGVSSTAKCKNFPGLCPWTPLGGSERPPNPQFLGDDADASSTNALRALIDVLRASQENNYINFRIFQEVPLQSLNFDFDFFGLF